MVDVFSIEAAISSLKSAGDIAKSFLKLRNIAEIQDKVIELQSVILSAQGSALKAQSEQFSLLQSKRELEEEMARMKAWDTAKQRYKLVKLPYGGSVVYALKKEYESSEAPHWICTQCYEDGKKSILTISSIGGGVVTISCPHCELSISVPSRGLAPAYV